MITDNSGTHNNRKDTYEKYEEGKECVDKLNPQPLSPKVNQTLNSDEPHSDRTSK